MLMEEDLTWAAKHKIQYTDDVFRIVHPKPI